jgi:hypothetical protein
METDLRIGDRIVVRTPDRRQWRGELVELKENQSGRPIALVRLDTGWLTSYPIDLLHREPTSSPPPDRS